MSEIDIHSRSEELKYYEEITNNLCSKFDDLVKRYKCTTSQESAKVLKPLSSSIKRADIICTECSSEYNLKSDSFNKELSESTRKQSICSTCLSKSNPNVYSPIWLLPSSEKLKVYETAVNDGGRLTEPEMAISFNDGLASTSSNDDKRTFDEITKYKRDIKRKRMKYRTTKAPPLTHTEELRSLISLQMELWEDIVVKPKNVKR